MKKGNKMDVKKLEKERIGLFREANLFHEVERIPHASLYQQWRVFDAGYKLSEALNDYDVMEKVIRHHLETYNFDLLVDVGGRNPYKVYKAIRSRAYEINDEAGTMNHHDLPYGRPEEMDEIRKDFWRYLWEKGMPRLYPYFAEEFDIDIIQNALDARDEHNAFFGRIMGIIKNEYGIPSSVAPNPFAPMSIEALFGYPLGIKGMSLAMRRYTSQFEALLEKFNEMFFYPVLEKEKEMLPGKDENACYDGGFTFLCQTVLNRKQWDEYYWKYLKQNFDIYDEKDKSIYAFVEGEVLRFRDCFQDYKKGTLNFMLENDDIYEFRKAVPNALLMGGMPNSILNDGTKEECIEKAKEVIDTLDGFGGGLVLSQTKIGAFKNDGKYENLKAVCDFVAEYKG